VEGFIKRGKVNKRAMAAKAVADLAVLFDGELPQEGQAYKIVTGGKIFPMSFIMYIAGRTRIKNLFISTFNYGRREIVFLEGLRKSGKLDNVTMITANMFAMSSKSGGLERLREFTCDVFRQNNWTLIYNDNHSKLVLLDTDDGFFVIETSCNFSESKSNEYYGVEKSPELFAFYTEWINSLVGEADVERQI